MKSKYDRQPSRVEERPNNVVCQEHGSPSTTVETRTFIEEDGEGVSKRVPSFMVEFVVILL